MTSAITYAGIDAGFPLAGKDNNSQGFRDNFSYIKTGLEVANSEITDLQNNTVKNNEDNDLNGVLLANAVTKMVFDAVYNAGTIATVTNVRISDGSYQRFTVSNDITLTFAEWSISDAYGKIRLELVSDGTARAITLATVSGGVLKKHILFPSPFVLSATATRSTVIDVWTTDGGDTIYVDFVGEYQ